MAFDQVKMINKLRKAQSELKKEIIEVEAGDGAVVIQVQVAPDGTVQSAEVLHGPDALRKASLTAIRQWRWMPTLLHGQAVPREAEVWFWYTLRQKGL